MAYANNHLLIKRFMKICLPTHTNLGQQSEIAVNFGSSPWLLIVESDTLEMLAIDRTDVTQRDQPISMDLIMCQSMSEGLYKTLREAGVPIFGTRAKTVAEALADYQEGDLRELGANICCKGSDADCDGEHLEDEPNRQQK